MAVTLKIWPHQFTKVADGPYNAIEAARMHAVSSAHGPSLNDAFYVRTGKRVEQGMIVTFDDEVEAMEFRLRWL